MAPPALPTRRPVTGWPTRNERAGESRRGQRLVALFGAACLLFNFPLLALWDVDATVLGLPLFPLALFVIWAVLIAALAWTVEQIEHG